MPGWSLLRNVLVGISLTLVLAVGVGAAYAYHRGWLSREFWAASQPCGELTASTTVDGEPLTGRRLVPVGRAAAPTTIAFDDEGRGFVAEREGRVLLLEGGRLDPEPVLDLTGRVALGDDQGLLGLAVDPASDRLFAWFPDADLVGHLVSWPLRDGRPVADEEESHLDVDLDTVHHNGGGLVIGQDGALYLGVGDGGLTGDPDGNAQDPADWKGKVVRFDPPATGSPEVFALGLRNPYRLSADRVTGDLWVTDVGHECMEEVDHLPAGEDGLNFGWNRFEGSRSFLGGDEAAFEAPAYTYPHDDAHCAVIGGAVPRGPDAVPGLRGRFVFGDFCGGRLLALSHDEDGEVMLTDLGVEVSGGLQGVAAGPTGELYVLSIGGGVERLT